MLSASCLAIGIGVASTPAWAQDAAPATTAPSTSAAPQSSSSDGQSAAPAAAPEDDKGLVDIVITAQRRSENLQRAAVAVTAIGGDSLRAAGVTDPKSLTSLVPALQISASNGAYSNFYLRGVGNVSANAQSDGAVAFNVDGVYVGRPSSTTGYFYDLERVEVLKGPQGTLYGRNATGGAINVISRKPEFENGGYLSGEYGNYNAVRIDGAINLKLSDDAAFRVAGMFVRHDGYLSDGTDDQKDLGGRAQLKVNVTPDLSILLEADYFHQRGKGVGGTPVGLGVDNRYGLSSPAARAFYRTIPSAVGGRTSDPLPDIQFQKNDFYGFSSTINWKTDAGTLTIIPAYRASNLESTAFSPGFYIYQKERQHQTSVEGRFATPDDKPLRLLVGGFYFHDRTTDPLLLINAQFQVFYQPDQQYGTDSGAAFGRLTYAINDKLRLTGGIRYTADTKRYSGKALSLTRICLAGFFRCPNSVAFPYTTAVPAVTLLPDGEAIPVLDPVAGTLQVGDQTIANDKATFRKTTYHAGIDWDISPRNLLYFSFETGFKSGGFFVSHDVGVFRPETITAYTIGSKNRFWDNRLQVNLEGFVWKYRDQQESHLGTDSTGATIFPTENVGKSSIKGFEADVQLLATTSTLLTADIQYLDAKYDSFNYSVPNLGAPPITGCTVAALNTTTNSYAINCSGKRPPQAPEWTLNFGAQQTIPLSSGARFVINARAHYQSRTLTSLEFLPGEYQPAYWTADAQVTFYSKGDRFSFGAFMNNITDKTIIGGTMVTTLAANGNLTATLRPPRTFGVRAGVKF
jgi:iron complex outermembrane receptor protein